MSTSSVGLSPSELPQNPARRTVIAGLGAGAVAVGLNLGKKGHDEHEES